MINGKGSAGKVFGGGGMAEHGSGCGSGCGSVSILATIGTSVY